MVVIDALKRLPRIDSENVAIAELLERAKLGQYALPAIERDHEWQHTDRIEFFDSIYRGFPIGTILLWEPIEPRQGTTHFGPFEAEARVSAPLIVIDGQQRLTTLFGCLLLPETTTGDSLVDWRFAFDIANREIVPLPNAPTPELLPLPFAMDTASTLKWARNLPATDRDEGMRACDDFSRAIRTYRIPVYTLRTEDRDVLEEAYTRLNKKNQFHDQTSMFDALFVLTRPPYTANEGLKNKGTPMARGSAAPKIKAASKGTPMARGSAGVKNRGGARTPRPR